MLGSKNFEIGCLMKFDFDEIGFSGWMKMVLMKVVG